jgi:hypothetical protein
MLGVNQMFGEEDIMIGSTRSTQAKCVSGEATLIVIPARVFMNNVPDVQIEEDLRQTIEYKEKWEEKHWECLVKTESSLKKPGKLKPVRAHRFAENKENLVNGDNGPFQRCALPFTATHFHHNGRNLIQASQKLQELRASHSTASKPKHMVDSSVMSPYIYTENPFKKPRKIYKTHDTASDSHHQLTNHAVTGDSSSHLTLAGFKDPKESSKKKQSMTKLLKVLSLDKYTPADLALDPKRRLVFPPKQPASAEDLNCLTTQMPIEALHSKDSSLGNIPSLVTTSTHRFSGRMKETISLTNL